MPNVPQEGEISQFFLSVHSAEQFKFSYDKEVGNCNDI